MKTPTVRMNLYDETCFECSKLITNKYSTSFSKGISAFSKHLQYPVYAIYAFVRYADEIVDTFHDFDKPLLLSQFKDDVFLAIEQRVSTNPVLHSFQLVVNKFGIEKRLIEAFFASMEMDIDQKDYEPWQYDAYIYGSAEVIGLMCLRVFCEGDEKTYQRLLPMACDLGSAFQKINFLRDIKADYEERGRTYFPGVDFRNFTENDKKRIEQDIEHELQRAFEGIKQLPAGARLGVYIAYKYYRRLLRKISNMPARVIVNRRVRVSDTRKAALYLQAVVKQKLQLL